MYLAVLLTGPDSSSRNLFHSTVAASRGKPLQRWPISGVDRATPKQVIVFIQIGSRMQSIVRMAFQADATTCRSEIVAHDAERCCTHCSSRERCLPAGLTEAEVDRLESIMTSRRKVARHDAVYRQGDRFDRLYAVKLGHFKKYRLASNAPTAIISFPLTGELLGMEAIFTGTHSCNAEALEDSEVCEIAFSSLQELFSEMPALLRHFQRLMSQEILVDQGSILALGRLRADQRFAGFLLDLSARYQARGYAHDRFLLRMSRQDIAEYLALTVETISRTIAQFQESGLVRMINREVQLLDVGRLTALSEG